MPTDTVVKQHKKGKATLTNDNFIKIVQCLDISTGRAFNRIRIFKAIGISSKGSTRKEDGTIYRRIVMRKIKKIVNGKIDAISSISIPLILKMYDAVLANCKKKRGGAVCAGIQDLVNCLSFKTEKATAFSISIGLLKLYQYCQKEAHRKHFDIVAEIIGSLRDTWAERLAVSIKRGKRAKRK
jgi:flagellar protein FliS